MKAILTAASLHRDYSFQSFQSSSMDLSFEANIQQTPPFFHGRVKIILTEIDPRLFGDIYPNDDEWDIELKITKKPKPKSQTVVFE
jgi:hypothetical protein